MTPLLDIRDLSVSFRTRSGLVPALDKVSLRLDRGEILGLVGESGAGKSLTGLALTGLLPPNAVVTGGSVRLDGQEILGRPEAALRRIRGRRIGMVFQDPMTALDPLMRIGEQLVETIRHHLKLSRRAALDRAAELLDAVGIPGARQRLRSYPHEFSGGMRQRVVIALALAAEPELIVADEPTTALDVSVQAQVLELLRGLCRDRGTAILLVTHDMGVIAETADRLAVLYAGGGIEAGPVAAVLSDPGHPYARGLMRAIPQVGLAQDSLVPIEGAMPRPGHWPAGCRFQPRCPLARAACAEAPPDVPLGSCHVARCHFAGVEEEPRHARA